ncbi:holo-[acyl-carrier-protein] synthase [Paraliobacillus ryukyuensis]|uniref:Holo-[acyl-carrier-protein] synthase n=1 Tax=Paraliobacillus ryukyuensis TaxID=200904 RepID=A0A366EBK1_9BACI|nr:holo-ACP synthase [Paraliobacillus ryukyuensis]RBO99702.1 holo-[acyl-carrier protein] synthase [Paraliobacillus ryukyuensis]
MINGIGIDIAELNRFHHDRQQRLAEKILTETELQQFQNCKTEKRKLEFLAGRFAAKEAFAKAYGTGIGKLAFKDIEVTTNQLGAPSIQSFHTARQNVFLSISHSEHYAVAQVIIES